jgi:hypothetical protein
MKMLVTGSRHLDPDRHTSYVRNALLPFYRDDNILVHGDAKGADRIAASIAREWGWEVRAYPADWKRDGRAAGPIRNQRMLREERPDLVVAFFQQDYPCKGTHDMVRRAREMRTSIHSFMVPAPYHLP